MLNPTFQTSQINTCPLGGYREHCLHWSQIPSFPEIKQLIFGTEIAKQGRAGCKNKECKENDVKIQKGELRLGTLVTIQDHQSWTWKHWGCVTPVQIEHWKEDIGGDLDLLDGYDELPEHAQTKVREALEMGHVADEDWKGDIEMNRPGMKGFRVKVKTPKKKKGKVADEDDADVDAEEKPKKKRGRPTEEDHAEEAPATKKSKGKGKKATVKEEGAAREEEAKPKKTRGKKAAVKDEGDAGKNSKAKPEKAKSKRAAPKEEEEELEAAEDKEPNEKVEAPKAKPSKKIASEDSQERAPRKRGRKKKATAKDE
ncbi:zf-PARP-domain-containing protein [Lojkania enalia]|uniref:Zf-PARP-domain-containing protein n=1 Tax=Lojkania enalia TaxID=147567 RepID=A0A9P4KFT9_9PLEO|nr:zf-PARP-domain-containing protein [Didymosphaeria enalia]